MALLRHGFELDEDSLKEHVPDLDQSGYLDYDRFDTASLSGSEDGFTSDTEHHPTDQEFGARWEKSVLANELRCAGLNRDFMKSWALTVIKILFYPELVAGYKCVY